MSSESSPGGRFGGVPLGQESESAREPFLQSTPRGRSVSVTTPQPDEGIFAPLPLGEPGDFGRALANDSMTVRESMDDCNGEDRGSEEDEEEEEEEEEAEPMGDYPFITPEEVQEAQTLLQEGLSSGHSEFQPIFFTLLIKRENKKKHHSCVLSGGGGGPRAQATIHRRCVHP